MLPVHREVTMHVLHVSTHLTLQVGKQTTKKETVEKNNQRGAKRSEKERLGNGRVFRRYILIVLP